MASLKMIDIAVNFTDGMFKGLYHGKNCHVPDIATVLNRAWSAGVDRIIVESLLIDSFCLNDYK
jgi:TatD DNase family protein